MQRLVLEMGGHVATQRRAVARYQVPMKWRDGNGAWLAEYGGSQRKTARPVFDDGTIAE